MSSSAKQDSSNPPSNSEPVHDLAWISSLLIFFFAAILSRIGYRTWDLVATLLGLGGLILTTLLVIRARRFGTSSIWLAAMDVIASVGFFVLLVFVWV